MRQYGCLNGNDWESNREFRADKARAVEDRHAELVIEEWLESCEMVEDYDDGPHWTFDPWFNGDCIVDPPITGLRPIGCDMDSLVWRCDGSI